MIEHYSIYIYQSFKNVFNEEFNITNKNNILIVNYLPHKNINNINILFSKCLTIILSYYNLLNQWS